jgi:glycosyltransferase involved in cell wall biosynthesis
MIANPQAVKRDPGISVIVPVHNSKQTLIDCLESLKMSQYSDFEIIVVDDCSSDSSQEIAKQYADSTFSLSGGPFGPGYARNQGAKIAKKELLLFVDADILVKPDSLSIIGNKFKGNDGLAAVFGSYDTEPAAPQFVSQFKNLSHHFVHQNAPEEIATFWAGCGAIRREVFEELRGFDTVQYKEPSIEDIELGLRMNAAGQYVFLEKELRVTHLKRWNLHGLVSTDILKRGIPWTRLIIERNSIPDYLNLEMSQKISAGLSVVLVLYILFSLSWVSLLLLGLIVGAFFAITSDWNVYNPADVQHRSTLQELGLYSVLLLICILGFLDNQVLLVAPVALVVLILLGKDLFEKTYRNYAEDCLLVLVLSFNFLIGAVLVEQSVWTLFFALLICILIGFLNQDLFRFFFRLRGAGFALTAFPYQVLYYLYSGFAFGIAFLQHLFSRGIKKDSRV